MAMWSDKRTTPRPKALSTPTGPPTITRDFEARQRDSCACSHRISLLRLRLSESRVVYFSTSRSHVPRPSSALGARPSGIAGESEADSHTGQVYRATQTYMAKLKRIGVLTGGGDAPGLNAVIRAVVKSGVNHGIEVIGLEDSFDGLIEPNRSRALTPKDVTGILRVGGTILGTTNRGNPFAVSRSRPPKGKHDYSTRVRRDVPPAWGSTRSSSSAATARWRSPTSSRKMGIPLVGVPKTIDNDIVETTNTFGFDTAVSFATDAIDRLHTTAEAHRRIMVVEVMGRYAGWIALYAGVAGGADVILIPEIPFDLEKVAAADPGSRRVGRALQHRRRRRGRQAGGRQRRRSSRRRTAGCAERLGGAGAQRRRGARRDSPARKPATSCSATCSAAARRPASTACWRRASAAGRRAVLNAASSAGWSRFIRPTSSSVPLEDVVGKHATCRSTSTWSDGTASDVVRRLTTGVSIGDADVDQAD